MAEATPAAITAFCAALGYQFTDQALLTKALSHRSWIAENPHLDAPDVIAHNERLEFLGDSVLGHAITDLLFDRTPGLREGLLAKARSEVVSTESLAILARQLGLGNALSVGKGEEISGGRQKDSILADAMEAVFGAMYLDGGWETAALTIQGLLADQVTEALDTPGHHDFKTRLQERAAEMGLGTPRYDVTSSGPDHGKQFVATAVVGTVETQGTGSSKKQAQQDAAEQALALL